MQAALRLEPLAGEAQREGGAGGGGDAAERRITGRPDLRPCRVGGEHGPPDVVDAHEIHRAVLDHRDGGQPVPDVFAKEVAGALIIFGDPVAAGVKDGVDRLGRRGQRPPRLPTGEVVSILTLQDGDDEVFGEPSCRVVCI